jgi:septal ring factor EnvC (AmiA/AmiB activator)
LADGKALASAMSLLKEKEDRILRLEHICSANEAKVRNNDLEKEKVRERERSSSHSSAALQSDLQRAEARIREWQESDRTTQNALQQSNQQLYEAHRQIKSLEERLMQEEAERDRFCQKTISAMHAKYSEEQGAANHSFVMLKSRIEQLEIDKVISRFLFCTFCQIFVRACHIIFKFCF